MHLGSHLNTRRLHFMEKSVAAHDRYVGMEDRTDRRPPMRMTKSVSAATLSRAMVYQAEPAMVSVKLQVLEECDWRLRIPERITNRT
jgi:hypothetical protein